MSRPIAERIKATLILTTVCFANAVSVKFSFNHTSSYSVAPRSLSWCKYSATYILDCEVLGAADQRFLFAYPIRPFLV
ncbi:hypothetical protein BKA62DRAFT_725611, partial [Auriculariales sp. MPI-PUGE-AT-0066]